MSEAGGPPLWQIRRLCSADAAAVLALVHRAFSFLEVTLEPPPTALGETAASIAVQIEGGGGAGAKVGGELVGSILWAVREGLQAGRLAVHPEWRGHGIARDLLASVDREARRLRIQRVHLETRLALNGNLKLFASCGFREFAREPAQADPQRTLVKLEKWLR